MASSQKGDLKSLNGIPNRWKAKLTLVLVIYQDGLAYLSTDGHLLN